LLLCDQLEAALKRKSAAIGPAKSKRFTHLDANPFIVVPRICLSNSLSSIAFKSPD
jgi:hypothetical protein